MSSSLVVQPIPLLVLSIVYLLWGGIFFAAGIVVYRGKRFGGSRSIVAVALLYQVVVWVIRVVGDRSSYARSLWTRELVFSGVFVLVFILLARGATRRTIRGGRKSHIGPDGRGWGD